jgi:hypothetical protein
MALPELPAGGNAQADFTYIATARIFVPLSVPLPPCKCSAETALQSLLPRREEVRRRVISDINFGNRSSNSRKFSRDVVTPPDKSALVPTGESVIILESC